MSADLYGLVLSGGRSTRMGKDKGLIEYHGKPQREFLFELLKQYCAAVYTSCNSEQTIPAPLNPLPDAFNIQSPINGILSAFKKFPDKAWLVVAIDMPNVDSNVLHFLTTNRAEDKVATCFYNSETKLPEPLLTIWEPKALPSLMQFVNGGHISPRDFLKSSVVHMVDPPGKKILDNINSPDQLPKKS